MYRLSFQYYNQSIDEIVIYNAQHTEKAEAKKEIRARLNNPKRKVKKGREILVDIFVYEDNTLVAKWQEGRWA